MTRATNRCIRKRNGYPDDTPPYTLEIHHAATLWVFDIRYCLLTCRQGGAQGQPAYLPYLRAAPGLGGAFEIVKAQYGSEGAVFSATNRVVSRSEAERTRAGAYGSCPWAARPSAMRIA